MSYTKRYRQVIKETIEYDFPASEKGGTGTITHEFPINIEIEVNTNPFDNSIGYCNEQINILSGSVIATEAAQVASINLNARKISGTIVDGFFGLIRSEISQQVSELRPRVETLIIELMKHQESCIGKRTQMEQDYARIAERYLKLFNELDKEMYNRIQKMNQSAFATHHQLNTQVIRAICDTNAGVVTVFNKEEGQAHSAIFSSGLKGRVLQLLNSAKQYLISEKNLEIKIRQIVSSDNKEKSKQKNIPVVLLETKNNSSNIEKDIKNDNSFTTFQNKNIKPQLHKAFESSTIKWKTVDQEKRQKIDAYFQLELNKIYATTNEHTARISDKIMQLWNNNNNIQCNN